ncbi:uncharacterized protein LOC108738356 [Agrilus planipennis]|uniref:Uncharacterized protein LOC108738356 n=1 Tax=Agrilus planipennis TaxID=224129 RepID=A0A1W4WTN3_AGRPL|nr:uncharacterized protein LOC108738356 [Agrilus planipennis]
MQISTEGGGIPQKAIDGSTSAFFSANTCTSTKPEKMAWWYVNLLEPYMVQLVRLDFGKSCCGPNKPATIIVRVGNNRPDLGTNPICNRFTGFLEEGQPLFLPCNPPMPGAFVSVHLETPVASQLSICEAFVYTDQALPIERCPQFRDQPPGSTATYNGKCYIFYNRQPVKFRDALTFCRNRGGTLVDESNPALQGFISWELWRRHRSDASGQYWMGAIRDKQVGGWKWLGGEEVTISFWNLPVGNGDCARYDGTRGWLWSDTDCNMHLNFICQHQPKACGRPEQPPNSTMISQSFNVGASVEYSCDEGHLLVGPSKRTCLETGFYNEFPPVCKKISCGYPADIPNGEYVLVNDSVGYLSRVIYRCFEGFQMVGRAQLACDIDEKWNGPPPRCIGIVCERPLEIENGYFVSSNNNTVFGTVIEYFCNSGYKLIGQQQITCMSHGDYDSLLPTCEEIYTTQSTVTVPVTPPKTTRPLSVPPRTRIRTIRPVPTTIRAEIDVIRLEDRAKLTTSGTTPRSVTKITAGTKRHQHPHIIVAGHPQDNEIAGSNVNVQHEEGPRINVPLPEDSRKELFGAKMNFGAIVALGAFGAFIFLAAIVTTIVILIRSAGASSRMTSSRRLPSASAMPSRWYTLLALPFPDQQIGRRDFTRNYRSAHRAGYFSNPLSETAKHYRHRPSPDCGTVASFSSSSTGSRNGGLNRYYRQAWENLHESAGSKEGLKHSPLRRLETMDEPPFRERNHSVTDHPASVVLDKAEKKRHHHHHHHHDIRAPPGIREHKRY